METDEKEAGKEPEAAGDKAEAAPAKELEPSSHKLDNPSRVVPTQQKFVALEPNSRWVPIHKMRPIAGIVVLKDLRPGGPLMPASLRFACCPAPQQHSSIPWPRSNKACMQVLNSAAGGTGHWHSVGQSANVSVLRAAVLRRGASGPADKYQHHASGSQWADAAQRTECGPHARQFSRTRAARAIRCAPQALSWTWAVSSWSVAWCPSV